MFFRIGTGFDIHAFDTSKSGFMLCGVQVDYKYGISAHSDGDVGLHALVNALLGSVACGDIGDAFPGTPEFKNADSKIFVEFAKNKVLEAGYTISNVDISIICQAPKISSYKHMMKETVAKMLNLEVSQISIKAATTDYLGFIGKGEGLVGHASVLIQKNINQDSHL